MQVGDWRSFGSNSAGFYRYIFNRDVGVWRSFWTEYSWLSVSMFGKVQVGVGVVFRLNSACSV
jgi:hypothetical protein